MWMRLRRVYRGLSECIGCATGMTDGLLVWNRQPIVTGTSVLAIKYKDGIMMAADNLGESQEQRFTAKYSIPKTSA